MKLLDADLRATLRRLADQGLELAQLRLALLGNELELEAQRLFEALLRGAAALLLLGLTLLSAAALLVVAFWEQRVWVLAVLTLLLGLGACWLLHDARRRLQRSGRLFQASLGELERDRRALPADPAAD